jgi:glycogen(starch) synthase
MRVLMFGWEFPPHNSGGLGVACLGLTNGLVSEDVEVIFVLPKRVTLGATNVKITFAELPENISHRLKFRPINSPIHPYMTRTSYLKSIAQKGAGSFSEIYGNTLFDEVLRYGVAGAEVARNEVFDVIHAHDWLSFGAGISAKRASGKPLIVHIHATEFDRSAGGVDPLIFELEKEGFEAADKIVAVSEYTKTSVIKNYGIDPTKIEVVHNGIDMASMEVATKDHPNVARIKAAGNKIVLFLGRFTAQKSPDNFLKAAKRVLELDPNVVFIMVGAGDMEDELKHLSYELKISDNVLFPGFLRGMEKAEVYRAASLYVMPSASEPFGLVSLEALVNGTPVIISKQSGVSEVLKHALKVDFWDVNEIANQILAVLHNEPLHQNLSENGHQESTRLTWTKAATKLKGIYHNLTTS